MFGRIKLIALTIALTVLSVNMFIGAYYTLKNTKRLEDLKTEVSGLEARRDSLKEDIRYKATDEYIEEKARNDLNLAKPGEKVYVVGGLEPKAKFSPQQEDFKVLAKTSQRDGSGFRDSALYQWYTLFFR